MILLAITLQEERTTNHEPKLKVPLAGDLLRREHITGAKKARMGCDGPEERCENISVSYLGRHTIHKGDTNISYVTETLKKDASPTELWKFLGSYLGKLVDEYVLTEFDIEKKWNEKNERKRREKESEQVRGSQESAPVSTENLFPPGTYQISRELPACIGQFVIIRIQNSLNANGAKWAKTAANILSLAQNKSKGCSILTFSQNQYIIKKKVARVKNNDYLSTDFQN